jgi:glyoxylase-like metal-dependent hydrolase (beta-lactamase superfamily II)
MATRLTETVWWCNFQGVNAYIFRDGDTLTLVDAGMTWNASGVARAASVAGGGLDAIERVLVTHYDVDHVGALGRLEGLDATIYAREPDASYLTGSDRPRWTNGKGALQRALGLLGSTPSLPVEPVDDGERIGPFTAYATPGHSPGHTAFVSEAHAVAFLGDLVRESGGEFRSVPSILNYDSDRLRTSLRAFVDRAPSFEAACMGHGTPFSEGGSDRLAAFAARQ